MSYPALQSAESLKDAFQAFNELSANLTRSYFDLEAQVARLTRELASARSERLKTLTEKEQLANRLQQLLEALPGGVIVVDKAGRVVEANPVARRLLGAPSPGLSWRKALERVSVAGGDNPHQRLLLSGETVSISVRTLDDGAGQIVLLTDISEQRALQELVSQQKRLSALGEMIASLAHQVRTPLAAALLYTAHLGRDDLTGDQRARFSAKLADRLQHLERQVSDMLAFARVGRLVMERVDVEALTERLLETFAPVIRDRPIRLIVNRLTAGAELYGNPDALLGILLNLLGNAAEALAAGGVITLTLKMPSPGWLRIEVGDDGPGIRADVLPHIFEAFYTTRANGTGLGLAIVDCVVRAHGGQVSCVSVPGEGACFQIDLPQAQVDELLPGGYAGHDTPIGDADHE
ncbi:PAS domain-containing sensor histidine kinase [Methylococcus sp. EFPC2]|uniref:sensor histidine kinase n=1 Tax=Methylococcus sp. EFPC2 TaxID=2812648 RepID=UPI001F080BC7|nr:ATP-binding protein [Methylococcus sp. EFPC2]